MVYKTKLYIKSRTKGKNKQEAGEKAILFKKQSIDEFFVSYIILMNEDKDLINEKSLTFIQGISEQNQLINQYYFPFFFSFSSYLSLWACFFDSSTKYFMA